jgi:hypothetical protein
MTNRKSLAQITKEFDDLRFSAQVLPIDVGVITERPRGPIDKLIVRIESGLAAGSEAFATSDDFPGAAHERALFSARARVGEKISFKLQLIGPAGIRIRPLQLRAT